MSGDPRGSERRGAGRLRSGGVRSAPPTRRCAGLATVEDVEDDNASPEASENTTLRGKQAVVGQHILPRGAQELSSWLCYAELGRWWEQKGETMANLPNPCLW